MIVLLVTTCLADDAPSAASIPTGVGVEAPVVVAEGPVVPPPSEPPAAPPPPARVAELSLARVPTVNGWGVQDGRARPVDAKDWGILTGDAGVLAAIEADRAKGRTFGWLLITGGGVVGATSLAPLLTLEDALAVNEGLPGFDEIGTRNDVRIATAFSLLGAGVLLAGSGLVSHAGADRRARDLTRHLDAAAVDAGITAYNRRLAESVALEAAPDDAPVDDEPLVEPPEAPVEAPVEALAPVPAPAPAPEASAPAPEAPAPPPEVP